MRTRTRLKYVELGEDAGYLTLSASEQQAYFERAYALYQRIKTKFALGRKHEIELSRPSDDPVQDLCTRLAEALAVEQDTAVLDFPEFQYSLYGDEGELLERHFIRVAVNEITADLIAENSGNVLVNGAAPKQRDIKTYVANSLSYLDDMAELVELDKTIVQEVSEITEFDEETQEAQGTTHADNGDTGESYGTPTPDAQDTWERGPYVHNGVPFADPVDKAAYNPPNVYTNKPTQQNQEEEAQEPETPQDDENSNGIYAANESLLDDDSENLLSAD